MDRPAFQRLLADISDGKVDVVVVYKIDRLTRSLADFAKIIEIFDAKRVSFVSVTQQFNTTTSMGRLTLNVLLSFAQFEREVTGERIRDKIAASKKKGMWMGGLPPLGYVVRDRKLIIVERRPRPSGYLPPLCRARLGAGAAAGTRSAGHRQQGWTSSTGRSWGGKPLARGALYLMLQNRSIAARSSTRTRPIPANTQRSSSRRCGMPCRPALPRMRSSAAPVFGSRTRACSPSYCSTAKASA